MPNIGEMIKLRRKELKLTQRDLAEKLGYKDHTTITRIENGKVDLVQSKIVEFANALECEPSYLMGWEDNKKSKSFNNDIGNRIQKARIDRNMTLDELSHIAEITVDYAYAIENGMNHTFNRDLMIKLAHILDVSPSYFLNDNPNVNIGRNIESLRLMADISVPDMAVKTNTEVSRIIKVENGTPPTVEEIDRVAKYFNIPEQWIINFDFTQMMNDERIKLAFQILGMASSITKEQREQIITYAKFILNDK